MSDFNELVARYIDAWNERDAGKRAAAVAALWTEDGGYTDPLADVRGHEAVAELIGGAQAQFPGLVFEAGELVDFHHDIGRFTWALVPEGGGDTIVEGFDVAVTDGAGRIKAVYGFLDKVPGA